MLEYLFIADLMCQVSSPMQAIIDFERKHAIPTGWVNFAIRYSSPNGYWQRLERGEIKMDEAFFKGFTANLNDESAWREFHASFRNEKKKLKNTMNPTQLGDHVSMKAEAADSRPTDQDLGANSEKSSSSPVSKSSDNSGTSDRPSLSKLAKDTTIGDPVSLESEDVVESSKNPNSNSNSTLVANDHTVSRTPSNDPKSSIPPISSIDGEALFWSMMSASREPDPYVFPALQRLLKQNPRPIVAALSNNVIFPPDHPWSKNSSAPKNSTFSVPFVFDPPSIFDVYVASAEVGMRKPSRNIYELALRRLDEFDRQKGDSGVKPEDVVFLDDIGENLKMGREVGMKTIKVQLGKTWRAVKELEAALGEGVKLVDEKTRRSKL